MKDLYKILSGKIFIKVNGSVLTIEPFSIDNIYRAEIYAEEKYEEAFYDGCLTQEEVLEILINNGWWSDEEEENQKSIHKILEQMKLDYYNNFHSEKTKSYIKSNITAQINRWKDLLSKKSAMHQCTCENAQYKAKIFFLLEKSTKFENGEPIKFDKIPLTMVYDKYINELLEEEDIRQIAKSNLFRSMWVSSREKIFQNQNLTDMQLSLSSWAKTYDNVYESPDCPSDAIIKDDLALDGWFIMKRKKNEEEKKKGDSESKFGNAAEIFVPMNNINDAKSIYEMNSFEGKRKLQMLEQDLKKHGAIEDHKTSSVRQEVAIATNKIAFNK